MLDVVMGANMLGGGVDDGVGGFRFAGVGGGEGGNKAGGVAQHQDQDGGRLQEEG